MAMVILGALSGRRGGCGVLARDAASHGSFTPRFAESVAITPQLIRDMLDHGAAFLPAAVEAERFARGIRRAVSVKRGNVGKLAFDAYRLAQAMNLALDSGLVVPEVEDVKASFGIRRRHPEYSEDEVRADFLRIVYGFGDKA